MKQVLEKIVALPLFCARFLNTLSLLEYIGARKILKSQRQEDINEMVLAHAAEEIRHAQVLKRAALKMAPDLCTNYLPESLLCGEEACHYFQTIDHAAAQEFGQQSAWHGYLYTTLLAEIRATEFYALFEEVLQAQGKSVFRGILVEEERHLEEIQTRLQAVPGHQEKVAVLKRIEEQAFGHFITAVEEELSHDI